MLELSAELLFLWAFLRFTWNCNFLELFKGLLVSVHALSLPTDFFFSGILTHAGFDMIDLALLQLSCSVAMVTYFVSHMGLYGAGCEFNWPHQLWCNNCFTAGEMLFHSHAIWFVGPNVILTCHMPSAIRCIKWSKRQDRTGSLPSGRDAIKANEI